MSAIDEAELTIFIEENIIIPFYLKRTESLGRIKLKELLKRKNPYLFRAKNLQNGHDLVKEMLNAFLFSSEETIFGNLLENLAVYICKKVFNGFKPAEGDFPSIDLIFEREKEVFVIGIKSGSSWGNADSVNKMIENLVKIRNRDYKKKKVNLISGICYGKSKIQVYKTYTKYQGMAFWELVSGDSDFYIKIIEPLGNSIKNKDINFQEQYSQKLNEMTFEMLSEFCVNNLIDWEKIVKFNSG